MLSRTPDETKKGLECCMGLNGICCDGCPYDGECNLFKQLSTDALALIQQLQAENAEKDEKIRVLESRNNALYHTILGVMHFVDKWLDVPAYDPDEDINGTTAIGRASQAREITLQAIEQLEAERDAAVRDLTEMAQDTDESCEYCKMFKTPHCSLQCRMKNKGFEWRGVQKEDQPNT